MFISRINFNQNQCITSQSFKTCYNQGVSFRGTPKKILHKSDKIPDIAKKIILTTMAIGTVTKITNKKAKEYVDTFEYQNQCKDTSLWTKYDVSKRFLISIECLNKHIKNGNIKTNGKKVDLSDQRTIEFLEEHKKAYIEQERRLIDPSHMGKKTLAKKLGVELGTIKYFIKNGILDTNPDGSINITNDKNKELVDNYQKYNLEKNTRYPKEKYYRLQNRLKNLPLEYCLEKGLLVAEDNGTILTQKECNKSFLEKIDNGEINHRTFFLTGQEVAKKLGISPDKVYKLIKQGKIIKTPKLGIDINNPTNKKTFKEYQKDTKIIAQS